MKKIILTISAVMVFTTIAMGCLSNNTQTEVELINRANALIEEKYEFTVDKVDYEYDLGSVLSENEFGNIEQGEIPDVVFLRAVNKEKPTKGDVFTYSIKFNTKTDEIISSECGVY